MLTICLQEQPGEEVEHGHHLPHHLVELLLGELCRLLVLWALPATLTGTNTVHYTLYIVHCSLYTEHQIVYNVKCIMS